MTTTHIMVDLETWGTVPGCDIRSIGAVVFDPVAGTLGDEFYVNVENRYWDDGGFCAPGGWMKHPLTRDPSTVEWWSKQTEAAQQRLMTDVVDLKDGLFQFGKWWMQHANCESTFWAHGPHFDEAILSACYRATTLPVPWHYRAPRDCRTIFEAAGDPCHVEFEGVQHDALADAKNQAQRVIKAFSLLRADRIAELLTYNNAQVEKRRAATSLLREAGELFRFYEREHRQKALGATHNGTFEMAAASTTKAGRNAAIAHRIETFLSEIHQ